MGEVGWAWGWGLYYVEVTGNFLLIHRDKPLTNLSFYAIIKL